MINQLLTPNKIVRAESSGADCRAEQFLGGGTQGEVYRADLGGKAVALKWYFAAQATPEQRTALELLVQKGPPTDRFCGQWTWPRRRM